MDAKELTLGLLEKGLTQSRIAASIGVQQSTVSKLLNGSIGDVSSKTYRALLDLNRKTRKSSCDLSKNKATSTVPSSSMDKPTANPFQWMGKSQAMAGVRAKSAKQIKQDAVRENPETNIGYSTRETNSFKAPR